MVFFVKNDNFFCVFSYKNDNFYIFVFGYMKESFVFIFKVNYILFFMKVFMILYIFIRLFYVRNVFLVYNIGGL